ncbi:MAG: hypothetical protein ACKOGJ_06415, partial [Phycisphaerales bacterium]
STTRARTMTMSLETHVPIRRLATTTCALAAVTAAKARADLDAALRQRLDSEESWLVDRLSQLES